LIQAIGPVDARSATRDELVCWLEPYLELRICLDDPDTLFQEYRARGIIEEKTRVGDTPWGTWEFRLRDLDGNGVTFYGDRSDIMAESSVRPVRANRRKKEPWDYPRV
jgi:hypothetical protein